MAEGLNIPLDGLKAGKNEFSWQVGKEFFGSFENSEILDANLDVKAIAVKGAGRLDIDLKIEGSVTVECDRCLDELVVPVGQTVLLRVKSGEDPGMEQPLEDEREIQWNGVEESSFDLSQTVYDYACLSVPMHHVHPEGECNPAAMEHLGKSESENEPMDSPFAALKGLLKEK